MRLERNLINVTFAVIGLTSFEQMYAENFPVYSCSKSYFDHEISENAAWSTEFEVDLSQDNFVEDFKPATPIENWSLFVSVNRASSKDSGRPGSEGGAVKIPNLGDDEVQFSLANTLNFQSLTAHFLIPNEKIYLKHEFARENPFQKNKFIEIRCQKVKKSL